MRIAKEYSLVGIQNWMGFARAERNKKAIFSLFHLILVNFIDVYKKKMGVCFLLKSLPHIKEWKGGHNKGNVS